MIACLKSKYWLLIFVPFLLIFSAESFTLITYPLLAPPQSYHHTPQQNTTDHCGIRANFSQYSSDHRSNAVSYISMSPNDTKIIFQNKQNEHEILSNLSRFSNKEFCDYARTLDSYEDFMLWLHEKIKQNKNFKVPGFHHSSSIFGKTKSAFHDFVRDEVAAINRNKESRAVALQALKAKPRLHVNNEIVLVFDAISRQSQQRNAALQQTIARKGSCFDYSLHVSKHIFVDEHAQIFNHCYGTELDKQLHQELCQSRTMMMSLESQYPNIIQVKAITPIVFHYTALAKVHNNPEIAFHLSDFCHHLTNIADGFCKAATILTKGIGKGVINTFDNNVEFLTSLITHPINDIAKPMLQAGISLGNALFRATELAINDPQILKNNVQKFAAQMLLYATQNPENTVAAIVEFLLPSSCSHLIASKQAQSIIIALREQQKLASMFKNASSLVTKIVAPIQEIFSEVAMVVNLGIQHGKDALQNIVNIVLHEPEALSIREFVSLKVNPKYLNDSKKLAQEVKILRNESFVTNTINKI